MADVILCDTNVVSVLLKVGKVHDDRKAQLEASLSGKIAVISFVTIAELFYWSQEKNWGESRKAELEKRLRSFGVLDPSKLTAELWAEIKDDCRRSGVSMSVHDLWIAAAGREYDIPIATADGDFDHVVGLKRIEL